MKTVLLVDDDHDFAELACRIVEYLGHDACLANDLASARQWLETQSFDHIFLDFMLPDGSGLHLVDEIRAAGIRTPITMVTGHPSVKSALSQLCHDGLNYLTKPVDADDFRNALSPSKNKAKRTESQAHFGVLLGESAKMKHLYKMIERVAGTDANVMLMGESGVGKEMFARAIHNASTVTGDLVNVNCGAIPKDLIGSELFGHEKGAFTGANAQKVGVFEQAENGTLFLDELTEMPIEQQPNLLRVLETHTVTRVGGTKPIKVNCRVISATNRSVEDIATNDVLREDIYFRLAVFPIHIPPLRERKEDIPLLAEHFLQGLNKKGNSQYVIKAADMSRLVEYDWPGNVRELKHTIHRAYIMADHDDHSLVFDANFASPFAQAKRMVEHAQLNRASIPPQVGTSSRANAIQVPTPEMKPGKTIEEVERELIYQTLESVEGNKTLAARMLGISTKTLYNRLNAYEGETQS
ncbi:sigma-54-dependent Fis family transcriptional regulator [Pseudoalteromonas sp. CO348]|uniref:sigma-54-dependent transcriptional regulator n=1 Tax=unclassified Pseudoalteromonas TaxID=194690 RepID=UPI00083CAEB8|nr:MULTISPECIES: sigma-54 dependent transcriptional regulator [unclassified Pseudoalteromonas]ODB39683.1 sigma-54-dependent Fis family transcriptional regulator [Pseudoalteromonas sp. BMB]RZG08308.1 sigma-54-dependent Fis family transcriptional regulator [Pseudoalteromonas sp. CO348]